MFAEETLGWGFFLEGGRELEQSILFLFLPFFFFCGIICDVAGTSLVSSLLSLLLWLFATRSRHRHKTDIYIYGEQGVLVAFGVLRARNYEVCVLPSPSV